MKKINSIIILVMIICLRINFSAEAQSISVNQINGINHHTQEPIWGTDVLKDYASRQEIIEKRDRFSKHFKNKDGSYTAVVTAGGSLNYKDASGKWQTIDTRILPNKTGQHLEYRYANVKNNFKTFYGENASQGTLTEFGGEVLKEGLNKKMVWLDADYNEISAVISRDAACNISLEKTTYAQIFPNIDLRYTQQADGRKMDYILQDKAAIAQAPKGAVYLAFVEDVQLPQGWSMYVEQDPLMTASNSIVILDKTQNNQALYSIPQHTDAHDSILHYAYKLKGKTIYTLIPLSWLNAPERAFPVVVDPTLTLNYSTGGTVNSYGKCSQDKDVGYNYDDYGNTVHYSAYLRFLGPENSLPSCATITKTNLTLEIEAEANLHSDWQIQIYSLKPLSTSCSDTYINKNGVFYIANRYNTVNSLSLPSAAITDITTALQTNAKFSIQLRANWTFQMEYYWEYVTYSSSSYITVTYTLPTPTFSLTNTYCQGDTPEVLPTTSDNSISGTWSPATISTSSAGVTNYVFTPTCGNTYTLAVTVNAKPSVSLTANPTSLILGASATLTGSGASTYSWSGEGLSANTGTSVTATPTSEGNKTYTLTGTSDGCSSEQTTTITVIAATGVTVLTNPVTNVEAQTTTLNGFISSGGSVLTQQGFKYRVKDSGEYTFVSATPDAEGKITYTLNTLTPATTYQCKAYASDGSETEGEVVEFTTCPLIDTNVLKVSIYQGESYEYEGVEVRATYNVAGVYTFLDDCTPIKLILTIAECVRPTATNTGKIEFFKEDWEKTTSTGYLYGSASDGTGYYTYSYTSNGHHYYGRDSKDNDFNTKWYLNNTRTGHTGYYLAIRCYDTYDGTEQTAESYSGTSFGADNILYWSASSQALRDITINFDWMCGGNKDNDYGSFVVCNQQGDGLHDFNNWKAVPRVAEDASTAQLYGQTGSWGHFMTTYKTVDGINLNNNPNLSWGVIWEDGYVSGKAPAILYDNIVLSGCPYEGVIASTKTDDGTHFKWSKAGTETTTLTVQGSHEEALYQWESSSNGVQWNDILCATSSSYTTFADLDEDTYYRCKVWYSLDSCPGVYQDSVFFIHVLSCVAPTVNIISNDDYFCNSTLTLTAEVTDISSDPANCGNWEYLWKRGQNPIGNWSATLPSPLTIDTAKTGTYTIFVRCADKPECMKKASHDFYSGDSIVQEGMNLAVGTTLKQIEITADGAKVSSQEGAYNYLFPDQSFEEDSWDPVVTFANDRYCIAGTSTTQEMLEDWNFTSWVPMGAKTAFVCLYNSPSMAISQGESAKLKKTFDFTDLGTIKMQAGCIHDWNSSGSPIPLNNIVLQVYVDNKSNMVYTHNAASANSNYSEIVTLDFSAYTGNHTLYVEAYMAGNYSASYNSCINYFVDFEPVMYGHPDKGNITSKAVKMENLCGSEDCLEVTATHTFPAAGGKIVYTLFDANTSETISKTEVTTSGTTVLDWKRIAATDVKVRADIYKSDTLAESPVLKSWSLRSCTSCPEITTMDLLLPSDDSTRYYIGTVPDLVKYKYSVDEGLSWFEKPYRNDKIIRIPQTGKPVKDLVKLKFYNSNADCLGEIYDTIMIPKIQTIGLSTVEMPNQKIFGAEKQYFVTGTEYMASIKPDAALTEPLEFTLKYKKANSLTALCLQNDPTLIDKFYVPRYLVLQKTSGNIPAGSKYEVELYFTQTDLDSLYTMYNSTLQEPVVLTEEAKLALLRFAKESKNNYYVDLCEAQSTKLEGEIAACGDSYSAKAFVNDFSIFTVCLDTHITTLPIDLLTFTATCEKGYPLLKWETASEENNAFFTIERSSNAIDFEPIAQITGAGNSSEILQYAYEDRQHTSGLVYYRLRQTDYNGDYKIYAPQAVSCLSEKQQSDLSIYPNPVSHQLNVKLNDMEIDHAEIVDLYGRVMPVDMTNIFKIDVSKLAKGSYFLNLYSADYRTTKRFIKQ